MKRQVFNIVFQPETKGGYTVSVPALPGCHSYGKTLEEARAMINEAILLYLEDLKADNLEAPNTDETLHSTIEVDTSEVYA